MTDNSNYGLYVGGAYQQDSTTYQTVAKYNKQTNKFDEITGGLKSGGSSRILTMTVYDNELYVGGTYYDDGTEYQYVAKYNSKENKFDEITGGLKSGSASIQTMTVYDNELYVGGTYKEDDTRYQTVAKYNKQTNKFEEITGGLKNGTSAGIQTMTVYDNELYVGGFYKEDGTEYQYVAKYNSKENKFDEPIGGLKSGSDDTSIYTMTVYDNELYVGGAYKEDDTRYQTVAKYNKQTNKFEEITGGLKNSDTNTASIRTMTVYDNKLYVGGAYEDGIIKYQSVAKYNKQTNKFEEPIIGGLKNSDSINGAFIHTMTVYDNELYVGGNYKDEDGTFYQSVAKYNRKENKFDEITGGLKNSSGIAAIQTMISFEPKVDDNNLGLILGLVLGIGIPILGLAIYYLVVYLI